MANSDKSGLTGFCVCFLQQQPSSPDGGKLCLLITFLYFFSLGMLDIALPDQNNLVIGLS